LRQIIYHWDQVSGSSAGRIEKGISLSMIGKKKNILLVACAVLFLPLLGLILYLADLGQMPAPVTALYAFPQGDKVGHFVLMGLLGLSLNLLLPSRRRAVLPGSLAALCLVTLEELSQIFFHSRSFSFADLGFSILGILSADLALRRLRKP
jgi:VanZ family protein